MSFERDMKRIESSLMNLGEIRSRYIFRANPSRSIRRAVSSLGLGLFVPSELDDSKVSRIAYALEAVE